ncbi:MAG: nucleoside recognition protein [Deltaproteobacteria bacterium]|nr:MAG: nucleoside recognition protein [Deltaproteobacteria bacterium]
MQSTSRLLNILNDSLRTSFTSALLIIKLVVPFYILADILLYFDILPYLTFLFEPVTRILQLPAEAALALAGGMLINLYAGIAFAAPLGLDALQWTVLAVFLGVCHSLIIECAVMAKLGVSWGFSVLLRVSMALLTVWPLRWMPNSWFQDTFRLAETPAPPDEGFIAMLTTSLQGAVGLTVKIILLITAVIVLMDLVKAVPLVQRYIEKVNTAFSIIAGQLLGISYGAGILIREVSEGRLSREDILFVATFLSICHSIIEDVLLFVIFGANFWVVVCLRLFFAVAASLLLLVAFRRCLPLDWAVRP